VEQGKGADKARDGEDRGKAVRGVPLRRVMPVLACVRNAGIVNRMSVECPA
jgi:hypothetical protein